MILVPPSLDWLVYVAVPLAAIALAVWLLSLVLVCLGALAVRWPARFERAARWYFNRTAGPAINAYGLVHSRIVFGSLRKIDPDPHIRRILDGPAIRLARGEAPQDVWDLMQRIADDVDLSDLGPQGLELDENARRRIYDGICRLCDRAGLSRPAFARGSSSALGATGGPR